MFKDIFCYQGDTFWCHKRLFAVYIPNLLVVNIRFHFHCFNIVYTERQDVFIVNGIYNSIGMQLVTKGLRRCKIARICYCTCVLCKNRCASETKQVVLLKVFDNCLMHIAELAAMAFIKNNNNVFLVDFMPRIFLDKSNQLLNRCNDNMRCIIFKLALQNSCAGVRVCRPFLETIILLHCLVVQILAIYHKKDFINIRQLRGQSCGFERSQCFARPRCMPYVTTTLNSSILFVVVCNFDAIQNTFCCRNLIRPHNHQHLFRSKDAIPS